MPKKHRKTFVAKPTNPPHHSLTSSDHGRPRNSSGSAAESPSVNDLISRLRRTQLPSSSEPYPHPSPLSFTSQRSVPPSLRNLLELPETPPPRPRPDASRVVTGRPRTRHTPGPPPPQSWLSGNLDDVSDTVEEDSLNTVETGDITYRLKRLPGVTFPSEKSLTNAILKSMATNWAWHLEYDGLFLCQLPSHLKVLLLSYIAVYGRHQRLRGRMYGLKPLFLTEADLSEIGKDEAAAFADDCADHDANITRLDLGYALGHWLSFKQLIREVMVAGKPAVAAVRNEAEETVPTSWDEEMSDNDSYIPPSIDERMRFSNLRYLSLAHPHPPHANWNSLLRLLSHLSTITHLSLAHWPTPSRTPHSQWQPQTDRSRAAANGILNEWGEAAGVLRKLCRATYCLKWLDLEGCSGWIAALTWMGLSDQSGHPGYYGPEWNASWRNIEWIGLAPGWQLDESKTSGAEVHCSPSSSEAGDYLGRSLAVSIHAPSQEGLPPDASQAEATQSAAISTLQHRMAIYQRRARDMQDRRDAVNRAVEVHKKINEIRRKDHGKWMNATTGAESATQGDI